MGKVAQPIYVCVYVPEFSTQTLLRLRKDLRARAVVVMQGEAPLEKVHSMNALSRRMGVQRGMTRAELDSFSGLTILKHSLPEETMARAILLETAGTFTPRVEVHRRDNSAFVMTLDMTGSSLVFGPGKQCVRSIVSALRTLQFSVRVAMSANLYTALCIAPTARSPIMVPHGAEAQTLAPLPLAVLRLTPDQADTFRMWGLRTIGELAMLPETDVIVRLGQEGKRLLLLARGMHSHLMVPEEPQFTLEERIEFDAPVDSLDSLLFVLGPMVDQLLIRAQNRAFALASITCRLTLDGGVKHTRTIKPALPLLDRKIILKLLHLDLQSHPPTAGILAVAASAEPGDRSKVQLGLLSPQLPEPTRLNVTLARIEALVGQGNVGRPCLQDAHGPERFTIKRFSISNNKPKECASSAPGTIALRRLRPPISIHVRLSGSHLLAFFMGGSHYEISKAFGPWRKSGSWWSKQVWSLEEWDVHAKANNGDTLFCLITYDLLRKEWKMAALYD